MDSVGRLLLRFILVPLGYVAAVLAGTFVILFGSWRLGELAANANSEGQAVAFFGFVFAAPVLLILLLSVMWLPASIGIVISEAFAIRSWMFHAGNGAVSAFIGWNLFGYFDDTQVALNQPLAVVAAGVAGGFAYWLIAGWNAGCWRPVFRAAASPPAAVALTPPVPRASTRTTP